ncbi:protein involved in gliding motility RemB [Bizionia echini]|uniref:Protein involved in gliding motility RemB n=1 Tax=Bizionia echini TaxID=649333 RepID=A0A1I4ZSY5_9FLAO|nr:gliding motility protein RemB [Bizionia echini]SFN53331.1 protein involved in gliding motility RemB [Bizionia echini]
MNQKNLCFILLLLLQCSVFAQSNKFYEKPPVFPECESVGLNMLQACFDNQVFKKVFNSFTVPDVVLKENYQGNVVILFEVDKDGAFRVIYVDAIYSELKDEAKRVFDEFPKIKPATYNGNPTFKQYSFSLKIPLVEQTITTKDLSKDEELAELERGAKQEYDSVNANLKPFSNKEYTSQLNIPFTHEYYSRFGKQINLVGTNSHTSSKPYTYDDVSKYYDFEAEKEALVKTKSSFAGRKLWNERLVRVEGKDYWFTVDPIFDFEVGKDTEADFNSTYNNTRGVNIQGGLGKKFNFYASVFESQGRFAQYYNQYAESIKAADEVAIIPGRGIAKRFKKDSYDYPVAEAYLSFTPVKFFNVQFGQGKNFIGDGYRSLFTSDVASPNPFLKLNTTFWKIKYTNTWMWLKDSRAVVIDPEGAYLSKYMATHFLSWNATKRLNIGFFESVIWAKTDNRGFDVSYLNPIIFYRAIEFETGQDAGNAVMGLSAKYKLNDNMNLYGQFILDEFSLSDITGGNKSWKNKYGYQLGIKYYEAFKVKNLMLQAEYNRVRPYTYSHNTVVLNYGHNNQSMAHLWGANFSEFVLIGRYHYKRWFGNAKLVVGERGLDFNNGIDTFSYGGDIYRNYNDRPYDTGVTVGQGNKTTSMFANLQAGYLINPATNLKLFADVTFRNFNPDTVTPSALKSNTVWFNIGIRTDLFNWYFDL